MAIFFGPNLFVGRNEVRESEEDEKDPPQIKDEEVTTHYWATALDYQFPDEHEVTIRLLGRYGLRVSTIRAFINAIPGFGLLGHTWNGH